MKKFILCLIFAFSILTFQSCDIDNSNEYNIFPPYTYGWYWQPGQTNGNGQYTIGGYVPSSTTRAAAHMTRAVSITPSDVIANYEDFALYSWVADSTVMNQYHGKLVESATTATWGYIEQTKFFDNDVAEYNFVGIIPQDATQTYNDRSSVDVQVEDFMTTDVKPNDEKYNKEFIVARTTTPNSSYASGATLAFEHQNSIIRIKFATEVGKNLEIIDFYPDVPGTSYSNVTLRKIIIINTANYSTYVGTGKKFTQDIIDEYNNRYQIDGTIGDGEVVKITGDIDTDYLHEFINENPVSLETTPSTAINGTDRCVRLETENIPEAFDTKHQFVGYFISYPQTVDMVEGVKGIIVLPATSVNQDGKDATTLTRSTFPEKVTANVSLSGITYTVNSPEESLTFDKVGIVASDGTYSPTNWYNFPSTANDKYGATFGFTIKFSYILDGTTKYDARVYVPADKCNWQPGKWYDYVINVKTTNHGHNNPNNQDADDPQIEDVYPIIISSSVDAYSEGQVWTFDL